MNRLSVFFILLVVISIISSCKKDDENTAPSLPLLYQYFPVTDSLEKIYHVDSIYWDNFSDTHDTVSYLIRELYAGTYLDNQNRETQRIERYRQDTLGNWIIWKVWAANRTVTTAEVDEDNMRYLKLVFPPQEGSTWNGNAYNIDDPLEYEITEINEPAVMDFMSYDSTLTVLQEDDLNALERHFSEERYAVNIGIYYRKNISLEFEFPNAFNDIKKGHIYTEKLISVN